MSKTNTCFFFYELPSLDFPKQYRGGRYMGNTIYFVLIMNYLLVRSQLFFFFLYPPQPVKNQTNSLANHIVCTISDIPYTKYEGKEIQLENEIH